MGIDAYVHKQFDSLLTDLDNGFFSRFCNSNWWPNLEQFIAKMTSISIGVGPKEIDYLLCALHFVQLVMDCRILDFQLHYGHWLLVICWFFHKVEGDAVMRFHVEHKFLIPVCRHCSEKIGGDLVMNKS